MYVATLGSRGRLCGVITYVSFKRFRGEYLECIQVHWCTLLGIRMVLIKIQGSGLNEEVVINKTQCVFSKVFTLGKAENQVVYAIFLLVDS